MATQIDKEKAKKQNLKMYLIIGGVLYLLFALGYLHFVSIRANNPRIGVSEAINQAITDIFIHPFAIFPITGSSLLMLFLGTVLTGALGIMSYSEKMMRKHDNPDTVNGEAHLMTLQELNKYNLKFSSPLGKPENDGANNMIISKDIRLAIDNRGTRRNCNILVIGGSGAGKSRYFASPNILQYNCNFVITDPSGEMLRDYGKGLEDNGYEVKVFNLTNVYRSNRYNPFHYIKEEKDVFTLVNTLIKNTNPSEGKGGDPFWEKSENLLLTALILYLWHVSPPEEQNFANVVKLINIAEVDENTSESKLDVLFEELEKEDPENLAVLQYHKFKLGAGKTLKSILISVGVRLQSFDLSDIRYLTSADDFEFERFADTKQALFVIIPTADTTFNFLVSLLYSQLFSSLYTYAETKAEYGWKLSIDPLTNIKVVQANSKEESKEAEKKIRKLAKEIKSGTTIEFDKSKQLYRIFTKKHHVQIGWRGTKEMAKDFIAQLENVSIEPCEPRCPNHIRLILDEFANIGQIPDFDQKLATMRKYEISCSIILQALSQLKDIYKDKWNTIISNCDTKLFLGCDDSETIEWMLKMLGKKTTTVQNTSYQVKGSGSTSYNKSSIEVMTIDQITMMQDDECLVRIRGVRPYYGKKYELTDHPNYKYAHDRSGMFEIPLSKDVQTRKIGALRDRILKNNETVANLASLAEGSAEGNVLPSTGVENKETPAPEQAPVPKNPVQKTAPFNPVKAKNGARKKASMEAKEDLKSMDDDFSPDSEGMIASGLAASIGLKPGMSDAEIKESAESFVDLITAETDNIVYKKTE